MRKALLAHICCLIVAIILLPSSISSQTNAEARKAKRESIKQCRRLLKQAVHHTTSGNYDSALTDLDSVLICDPKNPDAYYHQGLVFMHLGDSARAVKTLDKGVAEAPLSSRLKLALARLSLATGEPQKAGNLADAVLSIKPHEGEALYIKGLTVMAQGDTASAVGFFQQAIERALDK